jgi:glycosyltransferase involved in cell wall biosynthesis
MRVTHIITSLEIGGAQGVLLQLLQQLKQQGHEQSVISMKPTGEMAQQISNIGIHVDEISFSLSNYLQAKIRCDRVISSFQPDIIQSWLYHADFLTLFLHSKKRVPIIWGIHHSYELNRTNHLKSSTKYIVRINALFSKIVPQKIICCSMSAMKSHSRIGYAQSKMVLIPNGIDVNCFKPDFQSRTILRSELGLSFNTQIVGYIARYHPQKDHDTFFVAASLLLEKNNYIHFVLAGDKADEKNPKIQNYLRNSKFPTNFHFLGKRDDIPMITSGLDVSTLSSSGDEAFPIVIAEAMASGIPCVATDVGDAREMIGSTGIIVPTQNPEALSEGWLIMLSKSKSEREALGKLSRDRVLRNYTGEGMAKKYLNIYQSVKGYNKNGV